MHDQIAWAGDPPPNPTARIWNPKEVKQWVCLLGHWRGVWVHWMGKRSLPCLEGQCPAQRHRRPMVWIGYTPAALPVRNPETGQVTSWETVVLPIGPGVAEQLRPLLGTFPGPAMLISGKPKARGLVVHQVEALKGQQTLPTCPDVEATLYRLWQMRPPSHADEKPVE